MQSFSDVDIQSLSATLLEWGFKKSHAINLLRNFYRAPGGSDLSTICDGNTGKELTAKVNANFKPLRSKVIHRHQSADGTVKLLIAMDSGGTIESVLMPSHFPDRAAGCVSSQIGCAMGCDFCASTKGGLERSLEAGEIVDQFLHLRHEAASQGRRLKTIVFMGMGEPLHNLDNVIAAVKRITAPGMGRFGRKHITISTVGIVPGIERLCREDLNVHLAVSLHAPDEETRQRIIPTGKRYSIAEIMRASREFENSTGRIPTIEYTLLAGVNDSEQQAHQLAALMHDFRAHVNLIPYNSIGPGVSGTSYFKPDSSQMNKFLNILRDYKIVAHFRRTRGDDVNAACGQLRERSVSAT